MPVGPQQCFITIWPKQGACQTTKSHHPPSRLRVLCWSPGTSLNLNFYADSKHFGHLLQEQGISCCVVSQPEQREIFIKFLESMKHFSEANSSFLLPFSLEGRESMHRCVYFVSGSIQAPNYNNLFVLPVHPDDFWQECQIHLVGERIVSSTNDVETIGYAGIKG